MKTINFYSKSTVMILSVLTLFTLSSCEKKIRKSGSGVITTVTRNVSNFNELEVDGRFDVYVHIDDNPRVEITTDDNMMSEVQTFVQDGELQIEMSDDYYRFKFTKMEVHVYNNTYTSLDFDGDIKATVLDTIFSPQLKLDHEGSGSTSLKFSGNTLDMEINGSGNIQVSGSTQTMKTEIKGSGKIDALDIPAENVTAVINGSGKVYVHAINQLNATVNGSGSIRYIGTPVVNSNVNGSGSISQY